LIANDTLTSGVIDAQRDPGAAVITMAPGTALDAGSAPLSVEMRDGAGRTNRDSGAITLGLVSAGSVSVANNGPSDGSDVSLGPVLTTGPQSYANPNGTTRVGGTLSAVDSSVTFTGSVAVRAGVLVSAGAGVVVFAGSGTQVLSLGNGARMGNVEHAGSGVLRLASALTVNGTFTNSAGTFDANDQAVTAGGLATVAGGTYLAGVGTQVFSAGLVISGGVFTSSTGPMSVAGAITLSGGQLTGVGTVGAVSATGGTVAPLPGTLISTGGVALNGSTTLTVVLNSAVPAAGYSQLVAGGPVDVTGCTLNLVLGYTPEVGDSFTIVTTSDGSPISGAFAGLDEGATFIQGGLTFQITYQGGDAGNSVVVTRMF
jgi:hypothetical protein